MLCGLQGSGKTTTAAKLAYALKKQGRTPFLVPADLFRLAAVHQLKTLASGINVDCFDSEGCSTPADVCKEAMRIARLKGYNTLIVDTAGRLHVDEVLMGELTGLKEILSPAEILFVADAMTGQDAVNTAKGFDSILDVSGVILTKFDGDARGGAALSMRMITGKPIKYIGTGEKVECLEVFHPERVAGRILDLGDVVTLVEKAQSTMDEKQALELNQKIRKDAFTLDDFKDQLKRIKKMGSVENILGMIPGFGALKKAKNLSFDDTEFTRIESIINSMTKEERRNPACLNSSRRKRISKGSGTTVQDINKFMKQYQQMRKMMKKVKKSGAAGLKGMFQNMGM